MFEIVLSPSCTCPFRPLLLWSYYRNFLLVSYWAGYQCHPIAFSLALPLSPPLAFFQIFSFIRAQLLMKQKSGPHVGHAFSFSRQHKCRACIFKIYTTRAFSFGGNVPVHVWIKGKRKKKIKWNKGVGGCVERINVPNYISSRSCFHWSVKLLLLGVFLVTYLQMFSILFFIINKIFGLKNTTWIQDNIIYTFGFNVVKLTLPDVLESFSCLRWLGVWHLFYHVVVIFLQFRQHIFCFFATILVPTRYSKFKFSFNGVF